METRDEGLGARGEGKPPRRARFQVHLSTAIVLMFAAGGLMWLNVDIHSDCKFFGWPYDVVAWSDAYCLFDNAPDAIVLGHHLIIATNRIMWFSDISFILAILFSVWYACEWLIRRRALKKGP
jgi:hypothetical protein